MKELKKETTEQRSKNNDRLKKNETV